jgi:hypothetical protein
MQLIELVGKILRTFIIEQTTGSSKAALDWGKHPLQSLNNTLFARSSQDIVVTLPAKLLSLSLDFLGGGCKGI